MKKRANCAKGEEIMTIRKLNQSEKAEVLSMMKVFYASDALLVHPEDAVLEKMLSDALQDTPLLTGYGFEVDGTLAGYGMVTRSYSTERGGICVWIEDIYILPQYRGQGIGSAFLRFVERENPGAVRLRLEAEPENEMAMHVYQKSGFEVLGYTQLVKEL
jgi:GNAT superfamily N-acetyltransferase